MALTVEPLAFDAADLDEAVARGIVTPVQRDAMAALARDRRTATATADDEQFRLLTNFNDVFVTLAIVVLLFGTAGLLIELLPGRAEIARVVLGGAVVAAITWGLAGYFTLKRRMALPSIVLLLVFVLGNATAAGFAGRLIAPYPEWGRINAYQYTHDGVCNRWPEWNGPVTAVVQAKPEPLAPAVCARIARGQQTSLAFGILLAGIVGALAAWMHWRRYRVPITVAAGAGALAALVVGAAQSLAPGVAAIALWAAGVAGVGVFALAMRFDISDPRRETRRTDVAFWLHLLAAPLIVHPLMSALGVFGPNPSPATALIVVGLYLVFTAVALVIDRRALLVSALAYVLYAVASLLKQGSSDLQVPLTALVIGVFLVSLSALWRPARALAVARLPAGWAARLPVAG